MLKTQRLYARTFDSGTYGGDVDAGFLAGCGSCATADSSCDSGHAGGGHGDSVTAAVGTGAGMDAAAVAAGTNDELLYFRAPGEPG